MDIIYDHTKKIDNLTKRVEALLAQPLAHRRPPPSPEEKDASHRRHQDNTGFWNKIRIELHTYDGLDDRKAILWVNKIEGILAMNPPTNTLEKIAMASILRRLSVNWQMFTEDLRDFTTMKKTTLLLGSLICSKQGQFMNIPMNGN